MTDMMVKCFVSTCRHIEDLSCREDMIEFLTVKAAGDGSFYRCSECNGMNVIDEAKRRYRLYQERESNE